ncbi:DNA-binding transcriptional regulator, CsgD family [Saccharicrinis carchari]|uniref:DNA-binding transcriptional regulator, CsgD family n=2 Tax=Saccharicrinis carchari TaxID=1168039 RepID=A0A521AZS3_SACCC|nr:DNA-binding transcriptional regulator, CsgD family [Saccharicrinis carchari]
MSSFDYFKIVHAIPSVKWLKVLSFFLLHFYGQSLLRAGELVINGTPPIIHFSHADYNGDPQFWAACQDHNGVMYFGNNDGVLIFEGENWTKVHLPNNSSVRSLLVSEDGVVFAGGFNEFGRVERDMYGQYHYVSMVHLVRPENRNFTNIWSIHELNNTLIFRSFSQIITFQNQKVSIIQASNNYHHSEVHHGQLFIHDDTSIQLLDVATTSYTKLFETSKLGGEDYLAMLPADNDQSFYILTKQGSIYEWSFNQASPHLITRVLPKNATNRLTCAIKTKSKDIYIGTLSENIQRWTIHKGRLKYNTNFPETQDNTVLALYESQEGNIWIMLNQGLDYVNLKSPLTNLFKNASISDVLFYKNKLYLATNQGVFVSSEKTLPYNFSQNDFTKIPGVEGQAWHLQVINEQILCSHDRGIFIIDETSATQIKSDNGVWKLHPVTDTPMHYFICEYDGLSLIEATEQNNFIFKQKIQGFEESGRDIMSTDEKNVYWICHGYKGVFRIKTDADHTHIVSLEHYTDKNGLPSSYNVNVHQWKDELVFTTNKGIFSFNENNKNFEPHARLNSILGTEKNIRQIITKGAIVWVIIDTELAYFNSSLDTPVIIRAPFLSLKNTFNRSLECIVPITENNVLIGTSLGLFAYHEQKEAAKDTVALQFSSISCTIKDSTFLLPIESLETPEQLPFNSTEIKFCYSSPLFQDKTNVQYSYLLEGHKRSWSEWKNASTINFNHLNSGNYTLRVKARSMSGEYSSETQYNFTIAPIWYRTPTAYFIWVITIISLLFWLLHIIKRIIRYEKEKTQKEERKLQRVLELELHQLKLEKEHQIVLKNKKKLEEDVINKSKELVNYTMLLSKKHELMTEIQKELKEINNIARNETIKTHLKKLFRRIETSLNDEQFLLLFETHFERVHENFFKSLKKVCPDLTQKELRLSALIKMELSNKEIANIQGISVRGIETARYRLRKKINISSDEHFASFFNKISDNI